MGGLASEHIIKCINNNFNLYMFCLQPWSWQLHCCAGLHDTDSTAHTLQCLLCMCPVFITNTFLYIAQLFQSWLGLNLFFVFFVFQDVGFVLVFNDIHLWASIFSVILVNYIFMDGKCDYFQGKSWGRGFFTSEMDIMNSETNREYYMCWQKQKIHN